MAQLVLGMGMSHSPMVYLEHTMWKDYAEQFDYTSSLLIDTTGKTVTYEQLVEQVENRFAQQAKPQVWEKQYANICNACKQLVADVTASDLDVLIIIGDDQLELFSSANMPTLSIFYGDKIISGIMPLWSHVSEVIWQGLAKNCAMDAHHVFASSPIFARELLENLIEQGFDICGQSAIPAPSEVAGLGHAYGVMVTRLLANKPIPIVPILINTYYPPCQPTPSRCYDLGRALRRAIEQIPANLRVGIVASGGLSHFVTDENLDHKVLSALRARSEGQLRTLPRYLLNSGNSEIRNWVVVAAACEHLNYIWDEYIPVYRTSAGTGCGLAFANWS